MLDRLFSGAYNKTVVNLAGVVLTVLNITLGANPYVQLAISVAHLYGVFEVKNK
jgi:hypothetical protein